MNGVEGISLRSAAAGARLTSIPMTHEETSAWLRRSTNSTPPAGCESLDRSSHPDRTVGKFDRWLWKAIETSQLVNALSTDAKDLSHLLGADQIWHWLAGTDLPAVKAKLSKGINHEDLGVVSRLIGRANAAILFDRKADLER